MPGKAVLWRIDEGQKIQKLASTAISQTPVEMSDVRVVVREGRGAISIGDQLWVCSEGAFKPLPKAVGKVTAMAVSQNEVVYGTDTGCIHQVKN